MRVADTRNVPGAATASYSTRMAAWRFFTRRRFASRKAARSMSAMAGSTSSAGSQKTPCTGPSFSQPPRRPVTSSVGVAPSRARTATPRFSRTPARAVATPPSSDATTTRAPLPRATPVGLHRSSAGRSDGTGTRRGILSASSIVATALSFRGPSAAPALSFRGASVLTGDEESAIRADSSGPVPPESLGMTRACAAGAAAAAGFRSGRKSYTNWTTCAASGSRGA